MALHRSRRIAAALTAIVVARATRADAAQQVTAWTLSQSPLIEIGVVEGDPNYELGDAGSSIRLDDGTIVVADVLARELRFYDASGKFLRKAGRRGGGPGEFQWLLRVYQHGRDSVMAYDGGANRLSVFDTNGAFARTARGDSVSGDRDFPMDVWLFRRFWVEGALEAERRAAARQTLGRLPAPDDELWYRFARVDDQGNIWVREPLAAGAGAFLWTVFNAEARAIAMVSTPLRFDVHQIGQQFVLGRWRDDNDVNFTRLYRLERTQTAARTPAWVGAGRSGEESRPGVGTEDAEALREIRSALRNMVTAQEAYYADHRTYAQDRSALAWSPPEDVRIDVIAAHGTGWTAMATHRRLGVICGMGVGGATPPGWPEGVPKCG